MQTKYEINPDHYEYYDCLENIRKMGICNMWGAAPVLRKCYRAEIKTEKEASNILLEWIENYDELLKIRGWERDDLRPQPYKFHVSLDLEVDGLLPEATSEDNAKRQIEKMTVEDLIKLGAEFKIEARRAIRVTPDCE